MKTQSLLRAWEGDKNPISNHVDVTRVGLDALAQSSWDRPGYLITLDIKPPHSCYRNAFLFLYWQGSP